MRRLLLIGIACAMTLGGCGGCHETTLVPVDVLEAQMVAFCHPHHGVRSLQIFKVHGRVICLDGTVKALDGIVKP